MSRLVASFDPSAGSGTFQAGAVNKCSTLWVMNESPNFISLDFGGAGTTKIVQPWYNMQISLPNPVQTVNWSVLATLQSGSAPVSMVYVELFDPAEDVSALLSGPLFRQSNVGNAAAVASATSSVQNDGNAAGTTVVEATPTGGASSAVLLTNDGALTLAAGAWKVSTAGAFTALPAGAVPVASIGGGTLPSGVSVPAAQVGSGYPGADISGAVANASNATNLTNANGTAATAQYGGSGTAHMYLGLAQGGGVGGMNLCHGSGSATINHGLSQVPLGFVVNTANGSNSTTYGSGSYTSTTVYLYQYNPQPWVGIIYT